ncbi:MAG: mechanosensitive ion channel, partial [Deltaproteobacteria bacterium]|nr:mechanosensitive ion channel [Deltaproteobacteria bacterium]
MFASGFVLDLTTIVGITVRVVIILAIAIALNIIQKKMIPRAIIAGIPKVREESQEQLVTRTKTMAYVVMKVVTAIIWIIVFVMVLGIIEFDISPLLATLGVASLGLGFAIQNIIRDYLQGFFIVMEDWYR